MEQTIGEDSTPVSGSFDKSRVLDVKPLRCLVPVFPNAPNVSTFTTPQGAAAPFVCATPSGPFPNGVSPFYPFFNSSDSQRHPEQHTPASVPNQSAPPPFGFNSTTISNAVPINSFRTPSSATAGRNQSTGVANGNARSSKRMTRSRAQTQPQSSAAEEEEYADNQNESSEFFATPTTETEEKLTKSGRPRRKSRKRVSGGTSGQAQDINVTSSDATVDVLVEKIQASFSDAFRQTEGDRVSIEYLTMVYDLFRRRISQIEDVSVSGGNKRPDLRAATLFMNKGIRTNINKRIGSVPGVEIGDIFFFRMELCLVGLHAPSMAGIDYLTVKNSSEEEPLAVSIVSSGGYEDYADDPDVIIYSGQGGVNRRDKAMMDQKLERGNLALEKSTHRGNVVRVIRGVRDLNTQTGKIYVYDGLYKIQESWVEKEGKSGCNVFKYKFVRLPDQPEAFRIWKSVEQWKGGDTSRVGVVLPDLTSGEEKVPVSLVNDVDGEKGPAHFTYISILKYPSPMNVTVPSSGCLCIGGCLPTNSNCPCIQKNGDFLPYTANGLLVSQKSLVQECGPSCQCASNCRNRASQGGLKIHLEVFKTKNRGWGLRSLDPIRAGTFICEYAGHVGDPTKIDKFGIDVDDEFVFDATRTPQPLGVLPGDSIESSKLPFPLVISARYSGNVARFMNHSCSPNVIWQPVSRENRSEPDLHVAFYANRHIAPMTELTYDYGVVPDDEIDQRKRKCLCGSLKCKGFYCL
ncbi:histone-lysine N-methyltransferase, H3 lysine-9 specific SUVH1-like [Humulus lupulus]|uniref:histone-lysine N-methyltransferase, H3 lysine-9 specific SUVH1-like n=1 Tax=Humulus lupulus TaxID=3486 RepID=UPI002B409688|nr:histone-lysine N-methyltransferase, H3 lysine-9 specific SUVH1-like [Humulus lupulus]XP_062113855.1 histone-lysine N-methyltransferase, H3 lysine-9 specific SUVH1-like [Humulus lupulus]XP_062113856.1 histone-lysine N-methyltransferase, H3 lysine-9 specific SUVH1-like [Humulus lupulus]XP_062113857.1 histone-lysine N-methyltransferase, H3 lysine-9 specific SUVH1-like [Humulus lupulus]